MVAGDGTLVFVEVRSRADETLRPGRGDGHPGQTGAGGKAARHFMAAHRIEDRPLRFDVITLILGHRGPPQIRHFENAFVP